MSNLCVIVGIILCWWDSWCPCPKYGRESKQTDSRGWFSTNQKENFSYINSTISFSNRSCIFDYVKDTRKVALSLISHTNMTCQKCPKIWTFQMWGLLDEEWIFLDYNEYSKFYMLLWIMWQRENDIWGHFNQNKTSESMFIKTSTNNVIIVAISWLKPWKINIRITSIHV